MDTHLIELLGELSNEEWAAPTVAPAWNVRDVAAHLLDTALRKLSLARDNCYVEAVEIHSPRDVIDLVNRLNREGVSVFRRLSSGVLIDLMRTACEQFAAFHEALDPFGPAAFAVSWAGEEKSLNWFDTARELTERWHHQQQIRLATDRPGIMTPELYHPVLDCFLRGLPCAFRLVEAPVETSVVVQVTGPSGGLWTLSKTPDFWQLVTQPVRVPTCRVTIPEGLAWRLFTRGMAWQDAASMVHVEGVKQLAEPVTYLTAVVA